jgi:hypothetical protein
LNSFADQKRQSFEEIFIWGLTGWKCPACQPSNPLKLKQARETVCHAATWCWVPGARDHLSKDFQYGR